MNTCNNNSDINAQEPSIKVCEYCDQIGHYQWECPDALYVIEEDERRRRFLRNKPTFSKNGNDEIIKYVCDPGTYSASRKEGDERVDARQAKLLCFKCNYHADITEGNIQTIPSDIITDSFDKIVFMHSPIYGGKCLRPNCK
jgi:hypothetical protein